MKYSARGHLPFYRNGYASNAMRGILAVPQVYFGISSKLYLEGK
jgi:hypothetical protein